MYFVIWRQLFHVQTIQINFCYQNLIVAFQMGDICRKVK